MLSLRTPSRREFLRVGSVSLGGLSGLRSQAGSPLPQAGAGPPVTDKSVVFLFLHGGPSQIETFDPKMGGPAETRSVTGEVQTRVPGLTFGGTFPKLAARADRLSVVRSYVAGNANHDIKPVVCAEGHLANLGSAYASVAGGNRPATGMPTNVAVFPQSVDPKAQPMQAGFGNFLATGPFGANQAPLVPGGSGAFQKDMVLTMPQDRVADRRALLAGFDRLKYALDAGAADGQRDSAFRLLLGQLRPHRFGRGLGRARAGFHDRCRRHAIRQRRRRR